jgi:hypothetical protein
MFRIKHVIPTVAVTLATAALITPAAQAKPVTGPQSAESSNAAAIANSGYVNGGCIQTWRRVRPWLREVVHDTPLANPVEPWFVVTGRTDLRRLTDISVIGAIALGLIIMIVGGDPPSPARVPRSPARTARHVVTRQPRSIGGWCPPPPPNVLPPSEWRRCEHWAIDAFCSAPTTASGAPTPSRPSRRPKGALGVPWRAVLFAGGSGTRPRAGPTMRTTRCRAGVTPGD